MVVLGKGLSCVYLVHFMMAVFRHVGTSSSNRCSGSRSLDNTEENEAEASSSLKKGKAERFRSVRPVWDFWTLEWLDCDDTGNILSTP